MALNREFIQASNVSLDIKKVLNGALDVADTAYPASKVTWYTDFLGDLIPAEMFSDLGSGTGNAVALSPGAGGRIIITTASDDGAITANGTSIELSALDWRADQGGLVLETRFQIDVATAVGFFIGFTDQLATGTMEFPVFLVAADIDSDAANACGVGYDTDGTTAKFFHGGVKANTDTVPVYSFLPVAATWYKVRVEVSATGAVQGFINDAPIGPPVANAVTVSTPLVPTIFVANRGAAARVMLVDYFWVQANR